MTRRKSAEETSVSADVPPAAAPTFEEALGELEGIVQAMDSERLPLEELMTKYERGHQLLKYCQTKIEAAQQRIDVVTASRSGATLQPFTAESGGASRQPTTRSSPASPPTPLPPEEDDIRLF